jgi:hypothetical protein
VLAPCPLSSRPGPDNSIPATACAALAVNNVGTNIRKPTVAFTPEELDLILSTNLRSAYHLCQLCHPLLKAAGGGASVVFNSSVAGGPVAMFSGTPYAMVGAQAVGWSAVGEAAKRAERPRPRWRVAPVRRAQRQQRASTPACVPDLRDSQESSNFD